MFIFFQDDLQPDQHMQMMTKLLSSRICRFPKRVAMEVDLDLVLVITRASSREVVQHPSYQPIRDDLEMAATEEAAVVLHQLAHQPSSKGFTFFSLNH